MTCFVLTKIIKEDELRTIGIFKTLEQAEERAKIHIELFNLHNPERKIYIRAETDHSERDLNSDNEEAIIYRRTIWYRNTKDFSNNAIIRIEEFQIE